ncbi:MAG: ATP-binding cassette domain-containing protein [Blautia sp.]|nr:ATP-binding cassette domain-containing protein [Blautia sp.]MDY4516386.1 ATP-binding cassette domain-containing protein [Lachnospiraceae bacterium]
MIKVENISKSFGKEKVLDDVSLGVKKGTICGIIGRNGSGKTVLFKCICGFMHTDSGQILVREKKIGKEIETPERTGVLIEHPGFLKGYSGYQNLKMLAILSGQAKKEDLENALRMVGLWEVRNKKVNKYSMGMKQRLGIAQAVMEHPDLLVLDEPMNGLDNQGVDEMRRLFLKWKEEGVTILMTSHHAEDIQLLCDQVYSMDRGILKQEEIHGSYT